jgi:hypothetical protein
MVAIADDVADKERTTRYCCGLLSKKGIQLAQSKIFLHSIDGNDLIPSPIKT